MPNELPYPWSHYRRLQQRSAKVYSASDYGWGIEYALDYLLNVIETNTVPTDPTELEAALKRAIASGARRDRSRSAALLRLPVTEEATPDDTARVRLEVGRISLLVSHRDGAILVDAGMGFTDSEIAQRRGGTPGSVRTQLSRLRLKLAA